MVRYKGVFWVGSNSDIDNGALYQEIRYMGVRYK